MTVAQAYKVLEDLLPKTRVYCITLNVWNHKNDREPVIGWQIWDGLQFHDSETLQGAADLCRIRNTPIENREDLASVESSIAELTPNATEVK